MKEIFQVLGIFSMFISALVGFFFWLIQRNINQRDAEDQRRRTARQQELDQREQVRYQHELYMLKSIDAAIALGEATARAVQQIPDAHCNGDMHAALDYAQQVKHEKKDFLNGQALHIISDNSVSGDGVRRTYD